MWYKESGVMGGDLIDYTHAPFIGALEYKYVTHYVLSGKKIDSVIYGVSKENGDKLVELWNTKKPEIWKYSPVEITPIMYHHVVENSHFFTDINQILETLKSPKTTLEHLKIGLENTLKNGYNLTKVL